MIIYNPQWLEWLHISREAKLWHTNSIISDEQYQSFQTRFKTPLYTPNLFIRITLFFFTWIALAGAYGMMFIIVSSSSQTITSFFLIFTGMATFVAQEFLVRQRHLYQSGIDEAFLYVALFSTIGGVVGLYLESAGDAIHWTLPWLMGLPFLVWGAVRHADRLVTMAAYVCVLGIAVTLSIEIGALTKATLPFVTMIIAVLSYFLAQIYSRKKELQPWRECIFMVELLSLATFYCAGNYYVVREGNSVLMNVTLPDGEHIPMAFLFYAFTVVTPIAYVIRGLIIRDYLLLRTGLIAAVVSILTFRYYFHLIPLEVAITFAGAVLFLTALFTLRYLKNEPNGLIGKHLLKERPKGLDVEAFAISQMLGNASPESEKKFEGGDGRFGGGGASNQW